MVGSPPGSLVHQWSSWCTMVPNPPNRDPESPWRQRVSARPPPEHRTRTRSQISPEPWLPSIRIIRYQITNKMMNMMMIFFNSTMIYYDYDIIKCFAAQILSKDVHPPKTTSNPHQPSHHARNQLVPVVAGLRMAGNPKSSRSAIFRSQSWCKWATAQRRNFPDSFLREAAHLHKLRKKMDEAMKPARVDVGNLLGNPCVFDSLKELIAASTLPTPKRVGVRLSESSLSGNWKFLAQKLHLNGAWSCTLCQNSSWKWPFIVNFPIKHGHPQ